MRKFVKFAKNLLPGEKNGRKIGSRFSIVVSAVEEIKIKLNEIFPIRFGQPLFIFFEKFCVNKRKKVEIEHTESVKITTIGVPSKNVDAEPLTTSAINVDSAPITDDAYPAICPKGFIARAFKFPKINPKKEKLIIINIENHAKLKQK